ncbi:putative oxidoreductase [Aspergillus saccharolyticus JOP 1030-1]|uniref:Putative oxidoreductase n=1 Tax=Aspergillus saccharolyticus JOP 1030-1 TaxID=1450539 RepID=A0A318ZHQ5_9EURO|nr:putative oxidoreductase [Aspergillus saccharolyticus JOP 1030-1]PYH44103.1 putative oxidoreductase [Aspergillus saccharolyticus JOP 1030-1]
MPTDKYFAQAPPFPTSPDFPIVSLPTISLAKLKAHDPTESTQLFRASREWGFFMLDLRADEQGASLLHQAEKMFDLDAELFSLDQATLDEYAYDAPRDLTGYKKAGLLRTDTGGYDHMHLYSINQDDMLGNRAARTNAPPIEAHRGDLQAFIRESSAALAVILATLDRELGLEAGTLAKLSPLDEESETSVRLLWSPPAPAVATTPPPAAETQRVITLGGHTDIGTLTLLFHVLGGLQILPAGVENTAQQWRYVRPVPGCALVNLGDTLVEWTGELLRSSLHRVVTAPGEQATVARRSVAYLVRPSKKASMRRLQGGKIPAVAEGEEEETRPVNEWAAWRSKQIMLGTLKPQTRGGARAVVV